jgi:LCP family protein required for cell wall assembly
LKEFLKIFLVALVIFLIVIVTGVSAHKFFESEEKIISKEEYKVVEETKEKHLEKVVVEKTPLEEAIENSERINAVFMGIETENRSDVIMFVSFDPDNSSLDIMSIPRDSYYYEKGYEKSDQRKINAAYGRNREEGVKMAVEDILGVPVHYYISAKYSGVKAIVDAVGGVEVDVPVRMLYDDPTDNPPLHINIKKGKQVLDGNDAIGFLRYRHGNMDPNRNGVFLGGYRDGDLGRVRAQQSFIKSTIKKVLGNNFLSVAKTALSYVKTNAGMAEVLYYNDDLIKLDIENIHFSTLPGIAEKRTYGGWELSYFSIDEDEVETFINNLYGIESI